MSLCGRCGSEFDPGKWKKKFCSRVCSNSRCWSDEDKYKKSKAVEKYLSTLSPSIKKQRLESAARTLKQNRLERIKTENFDLLGIAEKRERLLIEQDSKCVECGIGLIWNNKPIRFHLDHINGDRKNETRNNLRMICPNCHSQTETYGGRNGGKITNQMILDAIPLYSNNHLLCQALGINPSRYSYERIEKLRNMLC